MIGKRIVETLFFLPVLWFLAVLLYITTPTLNISNPTQQALDTFNINVALSRQTPISSYVKRVFDRQHFVPNHARDFLQGLSSANVDYTSILYRAYFELEAAWMPSTRSVVLSSPLANREFTCDTSSVTTNIVVTHYAHLADGDGVAMPWFNTADAVLLDVQSRAFVHEVNMAALPIRAVCRMRRQDGADEEDETEHVEKEWTQMMSLAIDFGTQAKPRMVMQFGFTEDGHLTWLNFGSKDENVVLAPSHFLGFRMMLLNIIGPSAIALNNMRVFEMIVIAFEGCMLIIKGMIWVAFFGLVAYMMFAGARSALRQSRIKSRACKSDVLP